jgi:hypothetical protein
VNREGKPDPGQQPDEQNQETANSAQVPPQRSPEKVADLPASMAGGRPKHWIRLAQGENVKQSKEGEQEQRASSHSPLLHGEARVHLCLEQQPS